jgi:hypothetical protein
VDKISKLNQDGTPAVSLNILGRVSTNVDADICAPKVVDKGSILGSKRSVSTGDDSPISHKCHITTVTTTVTTSLMSHVHSCILLDSPGKSCTALSIQQAKEKICIGTFIAETVKESAWQNQILEFDQHAEFYDNKYIYSSAFEMWGRHCPEESIRHLSFQESLSYSTCRGASKSTQLSQQCSGAGMAMLDKLFANASAS